MTGRKYNKAIRYGKCLARHMSVLGNVHPIKIENFDIFSWRHFFARSSFYIINWYGYPRGSHEKYLKEIVSPVFEIRQWINYMLNVTNDAQVFIVSVDRAYKEVSTKEYWKFSMAQILWYDCTFKKQCTVPVTLTVDLWKSIIFQWIDNDPISVLYDFQIDISTKKYGSQTAPSYSYSLSVPNLVTIRRHLTSFLTCATFNM